MLGENGYEEVSGRCSDIGEGGLGTLLVSELTPGEVVAATIQPRVAPPLTVRCVVRYRKGLVHGLEFLGLTAEQLQIVRQLCAGAAEID